MKRVDKEQSERIAPDKVLKRLTMPVDLLKRRKRKAFQEEARKVSFTSRKSQSSLKFVKALHSGK
jgi:hypothetical protein